MGGRLALLVFYNALAGLIFSQSKIVEDGPVNGDIVIHPTEEEIIIDGHLTEQAWKTGDHARHFWQHFPSDTVQASGQTEIFMTHDAKNLYIGVVCHSDTNQFVTPSLRRDYRFPGSDNISLLFDTYNDQTNAFLFGINPFGVRREALISNGGRQRTDFSSSWDNKWIGEAKIHDTYWVAELAIPFKTIRYPEGGKRWRFNSYRYDTQFQEITTWTQIPRNQIIMDLAYMGNMYWSSPPQKPGANFSMIPYAISSVVRDYEDPIQTKEKWDFDIGGDAKIAVNSSLNLDLTFNPDFSQVEVDEQVTNLDRFEILLPEKRQFFLENADLFNSFGSRRVNPFFSRRIGVAIDSTTGQNVQNPIIYGVRLSGKINEDLRLGLLNMQTSKLNTSGLPAFNYSVAAVQQKIFSRSNLSFLFVNKQALQASNHSGDFQKYNRVGGLEYRLASPNNKWSGKMFYHKVFSSNPQDDAYAHGIQVEHLQRKFRIEWSHLFVGNGFDAEVGFVPRKDYFLISPEFELFFYPNKGSVSQHNLSLDTRILYKVGKDGHSLLPEMGISDKQLELTWLLEFTNQSEFTAGFLHDWVLLLNDFDPTRVQKDSVFLKAGNTHSFSSFFIGFESDNARKFAFAIMPSFGQFYNGYRVGLQGSFTYRFQPYGFLSIDYNYNHVRLKEPFVPANLWIVGPRLDLTFTKKLFFTTFLQYNSQFDNLNINTRIQWRFKPVSDFFIVYTDNYMTDSFSQFSVRGRALVAKVTYWLNL